MEIVGTIGSEIDDTVLTTDALGRGLMLSGYDLVAGRTGLESWQHVEDAAPTIVEQEDAEVLTQVLIPQGILIVEETEVADDTKHPIAGDHREACSRREGALDAIDAAITPYGMLSEDISQTDG